MFLKRHEMLMSAQELVASGMAQEGVRVAFDTEVPHVDLASRVIHVPPLAESVADDDVTLLRAFIDHETAHLVHTDTGALAGLDSTTHHILNAIEDGRVERLMGDRYYGCRLNFERAGVLIRESARRKREEGHQLSALVQAMVSLYYMSLGADVPGAMELVGTDDPDVADLLQRIGDVTARFHTLESAWDVRVCAEEIRERWSSETESEQQQPQPGEQNGEGQDSSRDAPPPPGGDGQGEGDPRDQQQGRSQADGSDGEDGRSYPREGDDTSAQDDLPWEASVGDALADQVRDRLGRPPGARGDRTAEGYTAWTQNDQEIVIPTTHNSATEHLYQESRKAAGPLSVRLMMDLLGRGRAWHRNTTAGRIDPQKLHRVGVRDERVFKRRLPRIKINSAMALLVDCSGSMSGGRVTLAMELAMAFSESCDLLAVPNTVLGFTTADDCPPPSPGGAYGMADRAAFAARFCRIRPLVHYVIKPFEQGFHRCRHAFANARDHNSVTNVDGESVLWAARRLCQRPESNLTLMVLSDGYPNEACCEDNNAVLHDHLRRSVARLDRIGMQVIGVGINSDAVSKFYPEYVVVRELSDLVLKGYDKISQQLRRARGGG